MYRCMELCARGLRVWGGGAWDDGTRTSQCVVAPQLAPRVLALIPLVAAYPCHIACDVIDAVATLLSRLPLAECKAGLGQLVAPIVEQLALFLTAREQAVASATARYDIGAWLSVRTHARVDADRLPSQSWPRRLPRARWSRSTIRC